MMKKSNLTLIEKRILWVKVGSDITIQQTVTTWLTNQLNTHHK